MARTPKKYVAKDGTTTYRVRFRTSDGRQSTETFRTMRAAEVFCSDLDNHGPDYAVSLLARADEEARTPTLDEVAEQFLSWKAGRVRSSRTVADYRRDYRNWISPRLGGRKVNAITESDVQEWVDDMHRGGAGKRGLSPKSIADRHALLHAIFDYARHPSRKIVAHNPTAVTDLPKRALRQVKGLRPGEWQALYAAMRQVNGDGADLAAFLLGSGWRWSEATALTTHGVEVSLDGTVHVVMSQVARRNDKNRVEIVEDAKSQGSLRRVRLDDDTAAIVRRRLDTTAPGGLVFTTSRGSMWRYSNFHRSTWAPAIETASLRRRPTIHELRHTSAGWLLLSGANIADVQKRLGHKHISTTVGVYGSLVNDVSADALDAFSAMRSSAPARRALG